MYTYCSLTLCEVECACGHVCGPPTLCALMVEYVCVYICTCICMSLRAYICVRHLFPFSAHQVLVY